MHTGAAQPVEHRGRPSVDGEHEHGGTGTGRAPERARVPQL